MVSFVLSDSGARSENEPVLRNNHVALKFILVLLPNSLRAPSFYHRHRWHRNWVRIFNYVQKWDFE